jgi:hypothetical protein
MPRKATVATVVGATFSPSHFQQLVRRLPKNAVAPAPVALAREVHDFALEVATHPWDLSAASNNCQGVTAVARQ